MKNATAALFIFLSGGVHARVDSATTPCERPIPVVIVDDAVHVPAWQAEGHRSFRLPTLAQIGAIAAAQSSCFHVLDADPFFNSMPGSAPELLLRARMVEAKSVDRSLGEKAVTAGRRYIGSYLGGVENEMAVLQAATVAIDVICVRERRLLARVSGKSSLANDNADSTSDAVLASAFEAAQEELIARLPELRASCRLQGDRPAGTQAVGGKLAPP
jgi:hypothetical protein